MKSPPGNAGGTGNLPSPDVRAAGEEAKGEGMERLSEEKEGKKEGAGRIVVKRK